MTAPRQLSVDEIRHVLWKIVFATPGKRPMPVSHLCDIVGLDESTVRQAAAGRFSENTRRILSRRLPLLELHPYVARESRTTGGRKLHLFRSIRVLIHINVGNEGKPISDRWRDPLLKRLRTCYARYRDGRIAEAKKLWREVNQRGCLALCLRFEAELREAGMWPTHTRTVYILIEKMSAAGILPLLAEINMSLDRKSLNAQGSARPRG
jgi:hypothetical protein